MNWLIKTLTSSVGKKPIMALTGFSFCIFLMIHLGGNLTIYWGKESLNTYVEHLHSLGPLITLIELGLLTLGILHFFIALNLFLENKRARPIRYAIKKSAGGQSIGSSTMPYTGLFLLIFIIIHLINFHFADKSNTTTFNILSKVFSNANYVWFYILAILAVAIHVSHGFWSVFQTIGINHPKYNNFIKNTASTFAIIIALGFGIIPIYIILKLSI